MIDFDLREAMIVIMKLIWTYYILSSYDPLAVFTLEMSILTCCLQMRLKLTNAREHSSRASLVWTAITFTFAVLKMLNKLIEIVNLLCSHYSWCMLLIWLGIFIFEKWHIIWVRPRNTLLIYMLTTLFITLLLGEKVCLLHATFIFRD